MATLWNIFSKFFTVSVAPIRDQECDSNKADFRNTILQILYGTESGFLGLKRKKISNYLEKCNHPLRHNKGLVRVFTGEVMHFRHKIYSHRNIISSNQLFRASFSKSVVFTNFVVCALYSSSKMKIHSQ